MLNKKAERELKRACRIMEKLNPDDEKMVLDRCRADLIEKFSDPDPESLRCGRNLVMLAVQVFFCKEHFVNIIKTVPNRSEELHKLLDEYQFE